MTNITKRNRYAKFHHRLRLFGPCGMSKRPSGSGKRSGSAFRSGRSGPFAAGFPPFLSGTGGCGRLHPGVPASAETAGMRAADRLRRVLLPGGVGYPHAEPNRTPGLRMCPGPSASAGARAFRISARCGGGRMCRRRISVSESEQDCGRSSKRKTVPPRDGTAFFTSDGVFWDI